MAGGNVPTNLGPIFVAAGQQYGIPAAVLAGIASVETSLGQDRATSSTGAQGLMQFEPGTAAQFGNDPAHNDKAAIFDAAKLLIQYGYHSNPMRAIGAYNGGPGNPQYGYANQVMSESKRLGSQLTGIAKQKAGGAPGAAPVSATPSTVQTSFSGGGTDTNAAGIAALMASANKPISTTGKVSSDDVLGKLLQNVQSGLYTTPSQTNSKVIQGQIQSIAKNAALGTAGFKGYVNPITGATLERTDMGLDAAGLPNGHPIVAIGDSKVVGISPNWYKGQPYVEFQFTNGPKAGHYYYISEAINPTVKPGQIVKAGQQVGTFNTGGTGLELGWGSPTLGVTLAQAQGNTGDASHNNAPQGVDFTKFFHTLH
jgi:hypothetical protein